MTAADAPNVFTLQRVFDAPRALVWEVYTSPDHLAKWFGPAGCALEIVSWDLRVGGMFRYAMRFPDGNAMHGRWVFDAFTAPEHLVNLVSFTDAEGVPVRHPMAPTWPLEMLSKLALLEEGPGRTRLVLTVEAWNATDDEIATFVAGHPGMTQGFGGTYDQLDAYLAKLASAPA